ncbi:MAG: tetratricopeptide repeat protein [Nitrospirae bacterium]|nr:tetratricopeptide repeat protein [Nitrospirota bacterium]
MHLSFGRLIWELKALPANEPFVYPGLDKPFSYSSWLFGLTYYIAYLIFGVSGVILLKATTITAGFYVLIRDSLRPYKNYIISIAVMTAVVFMTRGRFVERPDTILMVFLAFSIFSLNAYVYDNKKYIYMLPFVHMLWANSHSSINLMLIPFLAFIAGGMLQQYLGKKGIILSNSPSKAQLKTITLIFITSFTASLISPYFISQYAFGAKILSQDWAKQEILELSPPTWQNNKLLYFIVVALALSFVLNIKRLPIIHLFMLIPFTILPFTARRFIFIFAVTAGPIMARNLSAYLNNSEKWNTFSNKKALSAIVMIWIILYTSFTITGIKPFYQKGKDFGFGLSHYYVPEGALKYMDKKNITGRVFNTFQWGQYIIWRDFPKRTVFIDGRGYLQEDLLEKTATARQRPLELDELYEKYGFESILVIYPTGKTALSTLDYSTDSALSHTGWALVYWDDISLLYLKKGGIYDPVIKMDEYKFIKPANNIAGIKEYLQGNEEFQKNLIGELNRNINETGDSKAYALLGFVYNDVGLYSEAIASFSKVISHTVTTHLLDAYNGIAYSYSKLGDMNNAMDYFKKSLDMQEDANTYYNIGIIYINKGEVEKAVKYLSKALEIDRKLMHVYEPLIKAYQALGMEEKAKEIIKQYEKARFKGEAEEHFKKGLKAYLGKNYEIAIDEFKKAIEINPSHAVAYSNLGYIYFDLGLFDKAYEYQSRAVDFAPNYANAHYGLALVYKVRGDKAMAKRHWEEYLKLEPKGHFPRKAKEEIEASGK